MNTLIRWGKFNLVGAAGMVLQLGRWKSSTISRAATTLSRRLRLLRLRCCTTLPGMCATRGATAALATHDSVSWRVSISLTV